MRLWGWGPDLRDPIRAAALSAVAGRDPLVAQRCSGELADPQSVCRFSPSLGDRKSPELRLRTSRGVLGRVLQKPKPATSP